MTTNLILMLYFLTLILLLPHPVNFLYLTLKSRNWKDPVPLFKFTHDELPKISVQIPVYNEPRIIKSCLEYVKNIEYPLDKIEILILDDSTDSTSNIISEIIETDQSFKKIVRHIKREKRFGYKAGALFEACNITNAEFIAVFDVDFQIPSNFLEATIHFFKNERNLACVQTRWSHANKNYSLFTNAMSIGLDGHFMVEKPGRMRANGIITFNGTAGIWRRESIIRSGGWSNQTLGEDMDLSYRTQLNGEKFVYLRNITVDQEITPTLRNWAIQQTRWSRGFTQNLRLHFRSIINQRGKSKLQALLQLTSYLVPVLLLLNIICSSLLILTPNFDYTLILNLGIIFSIVSISGLVFYSSAIIRSGRPVSEILLIPLFLFLGLSLSLRITISVIRGFLSNGGEFIRTQKFNLSDYDSKEKVIKSKIPLDLILIPEFVLLLFLTVTTIRIFEIGPFLYVTAFYYLIFISSILLLFISSFRHATSTINLK